MLHFQSPLYVSFKVPRKETPLHVLLAEPLHKERCSISRALFRYLSKSTEKEPPSRFPSQSPIDRDAPSPEHSLTCLLKTPGKEPPSWFPDGAPMDRDAHSQSLHEFSISWSPHIRSSPATHREQNMVTVREAPHRRKAYIQWGAAWFPKGIVYDTAIDYPSAMQPSARYLPPWLG
jgi:hypothetical protein